MASKLFRMELRWVFVIMAFGLAAVWVPAATVTVDPGAGGDFDTILDAVTNIGTWGADAGDDVIELVNGLHTIDAAITVPNLTPTGPLTVRPTAGANPVVLVTAAGANAFVSTTGGTMTFQGLSVIGEANLANSENAVRFLLLFASVPTTFTVEDCIFTANNGSDQPRTDWVNTPFEDGALRSPITVSTSSAVVNGTVRNCALAGGSPGDDGPVNITGDLTNGSTFLVENCLSMRYIPIGMQIRNSAGKVSATYRNCAIIEPRDEVFKWTAGNAAAGPDITLEDCILQSANAGEMIFRFAAVIGGADITMRRCTSVALEGATQRHIGFNDLDQGTPDAVTVEDSIFFSNDELIAAFPDPGDGGPEPPFGSFTLNNCAAIGPGPRGGQSAQINDAIAALYGGTGPITADPAFAAISVNDIAAQIDGVRKWDSTTNTLFDVGDVEYCGMASDGSNLNGGAETVSGVCPTPVKDWVLY